MRTLVDKSGAFVTSQGSDVKGFGPAKRPWLAGPAVTISHQTGAGAREIAERLAELLQDTDLPARQPWTVLNRQLVETALEELHWPGQLARKMPEDKRSYVDDVLDDLFGLRPPSWGLVPQVVETSQRHLRHSIVHSGFCPTPARVPVSCFLISLKGWLSKLFPLRGSALQG